MRRVDLPDDGYGYDCIQVPVIPDNPTDEQLAALETAKREIERICEPASETELAQEIAKLRVSMARRDATETDERAMLLVFMDDVGEFPPDILRDACRSWRRREKWFPTPAELRAECQKRAKTRFAWREALRMQRP